MGAPNFEKPFHEVRAAVVAPRHRADLVTRLADLDQETARKSADDDRNRAIGEQEHHRTTMADLLHRAQRATAEFAERLEQARDQVDQAHRQLDDARLNLARTTDNVDTAARTAVATARSDAESLAAQQIDELRNERAAARAAADQSQHTAAEEQRRAITAAAAADHARQQVAPALAAVETAIADLTPPRRIIPFSHPGQLEPLPLDD
jgi:ABC-type transporter Mla subunit MlaD